MGKFEPSLILLSRPTMQMYALMKDEQKEVIEYAIKEFIKPNPVLRFRTLFRTKFINPKVTDFWNLAWEDLILLRKAITNDDIVSVMDLIYGLPEKKFFKLEVLNVFSSYKWITDQLILISNAEKERLHSELTDEEKEAGAEELMEYEYYTSLRALCPDLTEQKKYLKLPYKIVFRELACAKLINEINKKYNVITSRKNRGKRTGS